MKNQTAVDVSLLAVCHDRRAKSYQSAWRWPTSISTSSPFCAAKWHVNWRLSSCRDQFVDAKGDVALQVQQVDDLINQGVDAIILNPVDTQGVQPMIAAAQRAAIPSSSSTANPKCR